MKFEMSKIRKESKRKYPEISILKRKEKSINQIIDSRAGKSKQKW